MPEPSYPRTGFVPPAMDLSHLTGQSMPGGIKANVLPSSFDWRDNGGNYVTSVKDQSTCGSCYTFAALGNIESKLLIDGAGAFDFSENNAKECNWDEVNDVDGGTSCGGGNYFVLASLFSQKGTVLESCDPYVPSDVDCKSTCPYQKTLLDWRIISYEVADTNVLKQYIYTHGPVFTALYAGGDDAWGTELNNYDGSYTLYYAGSESTNHAVLIVGWDDSLSHAGSGSGGWIVKNSWGAGWGDGGYFTIAYGSASIGTSSSFTHDWQDYDTSGDIMYYDEGGWGGYWGYNTTGWGLVKFTPASNTNVTRVEFWTTDATTDVDVYLYDDFDGTTASNKLAEALNNSFDEAGYHSVALSTPVPVTSGDDVVAVVKFTTASFDHPVPLDYYGPNETGRTYVSSDGSSWSEASKDVAIRLRTSTNVAPAPTVTNITPSSGENTGSVSITNLAGSDFQDGAAVKLTKAGQSDINATGVSVASDSQITCNFDLTGAAAGLWNVVVANPDGQSGTLTNGFTVTAPPAPDVSISKQVVGSDFAPGDSITFILTIANDGDKRASDVVVTDNLPNEVLTPSVVSTLDITPTGAFSYTWDVEPLNEGDNGTITISGLIDPNLEDDFSFANVATISDPEDNTPNNNTGRASVGTFRIYLPLATRNYPPLPGTPVLDAISNDDCNGDYTVSWNAADRADSYILEEDDNASFSSPTTDSPTANTFKSITDHADGTYYYHVKARNSWGDGGWSATRSVKVCPDLPTTLYSVGDTCIMKGYSTTNFGIYSDMWVGYDDYLNPDGKIVRSLIKFDLSAIPTGTSIASAILQVYKLGSWDYPGKTRTITTYGVGSNWAETSVTWNTRPSSTDAYGSASVTHESGGWHSFNVTTLVRGWVNGTLPNYGVMLRGPEHSGSDSSWKSFCTREGSYDPKLVITYSGRTAQADTRMPDERSSEEPARVVIEALTGKSNADSLRPGSCRPYSLAWEKCLALP
jgi:uncharacterized repeat protein (TIGR01451 family)